MKTINITQNTKQAVILINNLDQENEQNLKIKIAKNVKASVIEIFINKKNQEKEYSFRREFEVEDNGDLEYLKYQEISESIILNIDSNIKLKEDANINMTNLELGLGINKNNFDTSLDAQNSNLNIFGLVKLYNSSNSSSTFNTIHNNKNTKSNISYKHSLHDSSRATYEATSIVNENALYSKLFQNSNTILLSDDAVIFARPHMQINIDELEASHGATTGTLDEEQLLYLQSRGISKKNAYEILLKAFENEVYDNIKDFELKEFLRTFKKDNYV